MGTYPDLALRLGDSGLQLLGRMVELHLDRRQGSRAEGIVEYVGSEAAEAFSEEAALLASTSMVSALDEFLLGLLLFIFAYGVFRLFIIDKRSSEDVPDRFSIHSVTDLKVKLLERFAAQGRADRGRSGSVCS